jgi:hypothetical protein
MYRDDGSHYAGDAGPLGIYSDAARRASDIVNLHLVVDPSGNTGRWVAIRLSDGGSDDTVYDCKCDAVRNQLHEKQCVYVQIQPTGLPARDASILLNLYREMYDNNVKMPDPPCMRHGVR